MTVTAADTLSPDTAAQSQRFDSIDMVRGAVMVLMALDHVRWFFTNISAYQPETLAETSLALFITRWITHFCAPGFFLLAGFGIFLYGNKRDNRRDLVSYLLSRGALLVALEFTIVGYSWVFTPGYSFGGVIWSLGCSFIVMALLVHAPRLALFVGAAAFILFHNLLLDGVTVDERGWAKFLWRSLYEPGVGPVPGLGRYFFLFPFLPWLAMMVLGYALGTFYTTRSGQRRRVFVWLGAGMIVAFALLRLFDGYGNPDTLWIARDTAASFAVQDTVGKTIVSFLNVEKYPPSLQFTLMTLGPIFLWLGLSKVDAGEGVRPGWQSALVLFGRVPLFYYICHLYLIHLLALLITSLAGQPNAWIGFGADPRASRPEGYGFDLWMIYLMWFVSVGILYELCRWYEGYKKTHSYAWLKYL